MNKLIQLTLVFIFFTGCGPEEIIEPEVLVIEEPEDTSSWVIEEIESGKPISSIEWELPEKISHEVFSASYPRICQVDDNTLFLVYHGGDPNNSWDTIYLRKSFDRGSTWSEVTILMQDNNSNYWGFSNPELLKLRNGRILLAFTGRGKPDDNQHGNIQVMHSDDNGENWTSPRIVAYGRSWEPAMIQHPGGDIMLFYSSEAQWWGQVPFDETQQEILMVSSNNDGNSWSLPKTVAYTNGKRDGMPVPLVLKGQSGILFAIESVGNMDSPWLLHSTLENRFKEKASITRWLAAPKALVEFGGGPYIAQLPTGETILSLHDTGGREIGSDWRKNTMYVLIGDSSGRNFSKLSFPFPNLPVDEGAFFNSIHVLDKNTVLALSSRIFSDLHSEVHCVKGKIIREL
jgi:hypothetical protein